MSYEARSNSHSVSQQKVHIVWATKYRYKVLKGDIKLRCRSILIQICKSEDVKILKGVVSGDHVHMHIDYRPSHSLSGLVKKLKGRNSRKLQQEFPELQNATGVATFGNRLWLLEYRKCYQ